MQTALGRVKTLCRYIKSLPDDKFLDRSKLKQIADNILNENEVPYRVENIVRKGEIACYKQFLLFSQCFPQLYIFSGIVW